MASEKGRSVNNDFYEEYGERWYTAKDDPVALLRAEARARNPWIVSEIARQYSGKDIRILDIGCGAGFLANDLARHGYRVTGMDASKSALEVARRHDLTGTVDYCAGDAYRMEFEKASFDVACAMDFLEHLEHPENALSEIARILKNGGLFFFHTFNRNFIAWLIVIKGVEWFVRNTPSNMHCLQYFIKPEELSRMCKEDGLEVKVCRGLVPKIFTTAFWKMLATGSVDDHFAFSFTRHTRMGYIGIAIRKD